MEQINLKEILNSKVPGFFDKYPKFFTSGVLNLLNRALHVDEINKVTSTYSDIYGLELIDRLFDYLNFSFYISSKERQKIPSEGRLIVVSNHPLGGLDGLALLKAVGEVRRDVKIVANDILLRLKNLSELFLPYDVYSFSTQKSNISRIEKSLQDEQAVIFFPAGKVSRLGLSGVRDSKWNNGALRFSQKFQAPILPMFVRGYNSVWFYLASIIHSRLGMFMLPHEFFNKKSVNITIKVGDAIPGFTFKNSKIKIKTQSKLLRDHTYKIGSDRKGIFTTEKTIIHPVPIKLIKRELKNAKMLGLTTDSKKIYLVDYANSHNILKEISRLRELTFRKVGEGTGRTQDFDPYDFYYKHIVLWDDDALEIVGSYRLGITGDIIKNYGIAGLYNSKQFELKESFMPILEDAIELGRSFIQQKYWRSNALDYIWQGIGAFLAEHPEIKYLWGGVSISDSYSELAKGLIVAYYKKWYLTDNDYATAINQYIIPKNVDSEINQILIGTTYTQDFAYLKESLKNLGFSIPVLYRRYTELTEYGGSNFIDFTIHPNFNNAIDGLIYVDLSKLKVDIRERYYSGKSFQKNSKNNQGQAAPKPITLHN